MQKRDKRQFLSLGTALLFLLTQAIGPLPAVAALPASEVPVASGFQLNLPPELGTIQALESGSGPILIHIQDAHGNYEAQKKIQAILQYLKDTHGIKLLLLEGSAFKLQNELIRLFPNHMDTTRQVLDELAKEAIAQGEELFLADAQDVEAYGVEDLEAYAANLAAFRAVLTQQEKSGNFLRDMDMQIERMTGPYLSKDLRAFLKRLEDFEAKRLSLMDWMNYLKFEAKRHLGLDLTDIAWQIDWPMLVRIYKLAEWESKMDEKAFAKERDEFLRALRGIPQLETLNLKLETLLSSPLSRHQLPDPETGLLFEKMVEALGADFNYGPYPNVKMFIGHLILQSEVKGERLMAEMEHLTQKISERLAESEEAKKVLTLLKDHRLLKRLFALELTPEDYETITRPSLRGAPSGATKQSQSQEIASSLPTEGTIKGNLISPDAGVTKGVRASPRRESSGTRNDLKPSSILQRFASLNSGSRVRNIEFRHIEEIDSLYEKALEFYAGVKARDGHMLQNIEKILSSSVRRPADRNALNAPVVIITGGFHAEPFRNYFAEHGFNYALIAPKITSTEGREGYLRTMLEESTVKPAHRLGLDASMLNRHGFNGDGIDLRILAATSRVVAPRSPADLLAESPRFAGAQIKREDAGFEVLLPSGGVYAVAASEMRVKTEAATLVMNADNAKQIQAPRALPEPVPSGTARAEARAKPMTVHYRLLDAADSLAAEQERVRANARMTEKEKKNLMGGTYQDAIALLRKLAEHVELVKVDVSPNKFDFKDWAKEKFPNLSEESLTRVVRMAWAKYKSTSFRTSVPRFKARAEARRDETASSLPTEGTVKGIPISPNADATSGVRASDRGLVPSGTARAEAREDTDFYELGLLAGLEPRGFNTLVDAVVSGRYDTGQMTDEEEQIYDAVMNKVVVIDEPDAPGPADQGVSTGVIAFQIFEEFEEMTKVSDFDAESFKKDYVEIHTALTHLKTRNRWSKSGARPYVNVLLRYFDSWSVDELLAEHDINIATSRSRAEARVKLSDGNKAEIRDILQAANIENLAGILVFPRGSFALILSAGEALKGGWQTEIAIGKKLLGLDFLTGIKTVYLDLNDLMASVAQLNVPTKGWTVVAGDAAEEAEITAKIAALTRRNRAEARTDIALNDGDRRDIVTATGSHIVLEFDVIDSVPIVAVGFFHGPSSASTEMREDVSPVFALQYRANRNVALGDTIFGPPDNQAVAEVVSLEEGSVMLRLLLGEGTVIEEPEGASRAEARASTYFSNDNGQVNTWYLFQMFYKLVKSKIEEGRLDLSNVTVFDHQIASLDNNGVDVESRAQVVYDAVLTHAPSTGANGAREFYFVFNPVSEGKDSLVISPLLLQPVKDSLVISHLLLQPAMVEVGGPMGGARDPKEPAYSLRRKLDYLSSQTGAPVAQIVFKQTYEPKGPFPQTYIAIPVRVASPEAFGLPGSAGSSALPPTRAILVRNPADDATVLIIGFVFPDSDAPKNPAQYYVRLAFPGRENADAPDIRELAITLGDIHTQDIFQIEDLDLAAPPVITTIAEGQAISLALQPRAEARVFRDQLQVEIGRVALNLVGKPGKVSAFYGEQRIIGPFGQLLSNGRAMRFAAVVTATILTRDRQIHERDEFEVTVQDVPEGANETEHQITVTKRGGTEDTGVPARFSPRGSFLTDRDRATDKLFDRMGEQRPPAHAEARAGDLKVPVPPSRVVQLTTAEGMTLLDILLADNMWHSMSVRDTVGDPPLSLDIIKLWSSGVITTDRYESFDLENRGFIVVHETGSVYFEPKPKGRGIDRDYYERLQRELPFANAKSLTRAETRVKIPFEVGETQYRLSKPGFSVGVDRITEASSGANPGARIYLQYTDPAAGIISGSFLDVLGEGTVVTPLGNTGYGVIIKKINHPNEVIAEISFPTNQSVDQDVVAEIAELVVNITGAQGHHVLSVAGRLTGGSFQQGRERITEAVREPLTEQGFLGAAGGNKEDLIEPIAQEVDRLLAEKAKSQKVKSETRLDTPVPVDIFAAVPSGAITVNEGNFQAAPRAEGRQAPGAPPILTPAQVGLARVLTAAIYRLVYNALEQALQERILVTYFGVPEAHAAFQRGGVAPAAPSAIEQVFGAGARIEPTQEALDLLQTKVAKLAPNTLRGLILSSYLFGLYLENPSALLTQFELADAAKRGNQSKGPLLVVFVTNAKQFRSKLRYALTYQGNELNAERRSRAIQYAGPLLDETIRIIELQPGETETAAVNQYVAANPGMGILAETVDGGLQGPTVLPFVVLPKLAQSTSHLIPYVGAEAMYFGALGIQPELLQAQLIRELGIHVDIVRRGTQAFLVIADTLRGFAERLRSEHRIQIAA